MNPALINGERMDKNRTEGEARADREAASKRFQAESERDCKAAIEFNKMLFGAFK